jgi:hypothetical protein
MRPGEEKKKKATEIDDRPNGTREKNKGGRAAAGLDRAVACTDVQNIILYIMIEYDISRCAHE